MRALVRFRWLLSAIALPVCVAALGVGIQAAAFQRPPRDALAATDAMRQLLRFRVMRATETIDRRSVGSICVQGWYHAAHRRQLSAGELVLLGNGEKLYDFGNGVRRIGRRGRVGKLDLARFLLAGCPHFIGAGVGKRLIGSRWIDVDPSSTDGASTLTLSLGERAKPIDLYVAKRTYQPVELSLSGAPARGWSDLTPGGGRAAVARVRRAFRLSTTGGVKHV